MSSKDFLVGRAARIVGRSGSSSRCGRKYPMSTMIVTLAIEDAAVDPLGIKEAIAVDMEKYGSAVRVLRVDVREPEQIRIYKE